MLSSVRWGVGQATNRAIANITTAIPQKIPVLVFSFTGMSRSGPLSQSILLMFSRSRRRREANTTTPMISGGIHGSGDSGHLDPVLDRGDLLVGLPLNLLDPPFAVPF
jgi:hypothetical protein